MSSIPQPGLIGSRILGVGSAFPSRILTNEELARRVETSDDWIVERTGIRTRRISESGNPDELNSSLGARASIRALEMAGIRADELDLIVYGTCTPDTLIPSTACWLQSKIGATKAWAFDLNGACSGFLYGLATADQFIRGGQIRNALVVGADVLSAFTDWQDRSSCILFGDGAGAAILQRTDATAPRRILSSHLGTDGELWDLFHIEAGGSKLEVTPEVFAKRQHKMQMKGREIFKAAVRTMGEQAQIALTANGLEIGDVDWIITHQANLRIIEAVAKRLDVPMSKFLTNMDRFGNTSAATIPSVLDEAVRDGRIQAGQKILLVAFGAGLTYGSVLLSW